MVDGAILAYPYTIQPEIRTERLILRPLVQNDFDVFFSYRSSEDVICYAMMPAQTEEMASASLSRWIAATSLTSDDDMIIYAVELIDHPGLIGEVSIRLSSVANLTAELSWMFHPDYHGHGYATEAALELLPICFDKMQLHRVIAEIDPRNLASERVCQRLQMRKEAHFVEDIWERGEWVGTIIYARLDREWRPLAT